MPKDEKFDPIEHALLAGVRKRLRRRPPVSDALATHASEPEQRLPDSHQRETPFLFPTISDLPGLLLTSSITAALQQGEHLHQDNTSSDRSSTVSSQPAPLLPHFSSKLEVPSPANSVTLREDDPNLDVGDLLQIHTDDPTDSILVDGASQLGATPFSHETLLSTIEQGRPKDDKIWSQVFETSEVEEVDLLEESGYDQPDTSLLSREPFPAHKGVNNNQTIQSAKSSSCGIWEKQVVTSELDAFLYSLRHHHLLNVRPSDASIDDSEGYTEASAAWIRGLYVSLFFIGLVILGNIAGGLYLLVRPEKTEHPYTCPTANCRRMALWISSAMDKKTHPCDDFYQFACGKYKAKNPPTTPGPSEPLYLFSDGIPMNFKENVRVGRFLKKAQTFPENQILPYYQACIDIRRRDKHGVKPLINLFAQIRLFATQSGSYSHYHRFNIARVMGRIFRKTNKLFFVDLDDVVDNIIRFKLATPATEVLLTPADIYAEAMRKALYLIADDLFIDGPEEIDTIVYLVMEFEAQLAIIQSKGSESYVFGFPTNFDDFVQRPDKFHSNYNRNRGLFEWDDLVAAIMGYHPLDYRSYEIYFNLYSSFYSKSDRYYGLHLQTLLKDTPAYVIFRYFQWQLIKMFAFDLNEEMQNVMLAIFRSHGSDLVHRCFRSLFSDLHVLAGHHYKMLMSNPDEIDRNMTAIAEKIFATYIEGVSHLELSQAFKLSMLATSNTRKIATEKLNALVPHLKQYYGMLNCSKDHFINVIQARSIKAKNVVLKAERKPPFHKWLDGSFSLTDVTETSMADSWSTSRFMHIPFGAVQEPFMGNDLPILNYAGYGHYMVSFFLIRSAFDDLFDTYYKTTKSIEPRDEIVAVKHFQKEFLDKVECVVESFSKIRLRNFPHLEVNAAVESTRMKMLTHTFSVELTLLVIDKIFNATNYDTEPPASSPMHELLQSNQQITQRFPRYQLLPGLEKYTPRQLAHLSIARQNCQSHHPERVAYRMKYGPLLRELGVQGSFRNTEAFASVWNCPKRSLMNPSKKCALFNGKKLPPEKLGPEQDPAEAFPNIESEHDHDDDDHDQP